MLQKKRALPFVLLAVGVVVGMGLISAALNVTPSVCGLCHQADVKAWRSSTHDKVSCLTCHQAGGAIGFAAGQLDLARMSSIKLIGGPGRPIRARVDSELCEKCHADVNSKIVEKNGIRMEHASVTKKGIACVDCHNEVVHGKAVPVPQRVTMDKCVTCHKGKDDGLPDCQLCHTRKAERSPTSKVGFWATIHGKSWQKTHGMGNLESCGACHSKSKCSSCHLAMPHPDGWPSEHSVTVRNKDKESCLKCHSEAFCSSCHRMEMPHPGGFIKIHASEVKKRGQSGARDCYNCHQKEACSSCHERHTHPGGVVPMQTRSGP